MLEIVNVTYYVSDICLVVLFCHVLITYSYTHQHIRKRWVIHQFMRCCHTSSRHCCCSILLRVCVCFVFPVVYLLVFHVCFVMFSWTYWKSIFTPPASPCKKVSWPLIYLLNHLWHLEFKTNVVLIMACVCVCCSSSSCHTQTSRDTRWKRGQMHRSKSWLRLQRNCLSSLELNPEVESVKSLFFHFKNILTYNIIQLFAICLNHCNMSCILATECHLAHNLCMLRANGLRQ